MEELIILLCNFGYTKEESKEILNTYPLNTCKPETLKKKIEEINMYMEKLGYSRAEVIKMTKSQPAIYGYSIDNIKQKIEDMEKLGYSKEKVIKMTKSLLAIYSYSIDTLKQKIDFYDSIGLHELAINDTKQLMQSVSLSYARYMFYKEKSIEITDRSYKKLFIGKKRFEKAYGITKEELLEKYDYQAYIQQKKTQDLGKETLEIQKGTSYIKQTEQAMNNQEQMLEQKNQADINID